MPVVVENVVQIRRPNLCWYITDAFTLELSSMMNSRFECLCESCTYLVVEYNAGFQRFPGRSLLIIFIIEVIFVFRFILFIFFKTLK